MSIVEGDKVRVLPLPEINDSEYPAEITAEQIEDDKKLRELLGNAEGIVTQVNDVFGIAIVIGVQLPKELAQAIRDIFPEVITDRDEMGFTEDEVEKVV